MDCFLAIVTALLLAGAGRAADELLPAPLGTRVADFTLPKADGGTWSLIRRTRGARAIVVLFLGTECPVSNAYVPVLAALHEKYRGEGVVFVAVNSNVQDDVAEVAQHARAFGVPFPVLKDNGTEVADHFRARRVPEAFVLDGNRTARYRGRIDDRFAKGVKRPRATTDDLAAALDDVLAGKAVRTPVTEVSGCPIGRAERVKTEVAPAQAVTYCKQVARILQNSCQACHRPGEAGPFQLLTYADAAAWADAIAENVREGRMPPWHADPAHGTFANDRRLSDADHRALLAWVDQGCPEGDAAELPAPRRFVEGWGIGQPDEIIAINKEMKVPAQAPSGGVPYRYILAGKPFDRDRWVSAAEVRPGNRSLVHHINVYVLRPGRKQLPAGDEISERLGKELFEDPSEASMRDIPELVSYAPGDPSFELPAGMAKRIPKGSQLVFELHLVPDGKARTDRSSVGLKYLDGPPEREVIGGIALNWAFLIPPGAANHRVTATHIFKRESVILSLSPHMHLRGKSFEYALITPGGTREVLLSVPKYDFNWQTTYHLAEPRRVPKGATLECTAVYDNSENNPSNPDPRAFVIWGDQSWNEMLLGYFDYYHP
jgi:thiol-disulfide isomerase/thioredoxin/mono/diheme cytochrome c family protein